MAEVLALDPAQCRSRHVMGGGFGRRLEWDVAVEAAQIAKVAGAAGAAGLEPGRRPAARLLPAGSVHALAGRLDDEGRVLDVSHRVAAVEGLPGSVGVSEDAAGFALGESPYSFGVASSVAMVNHPVRTGPWRGVFMSQTGPALETFVDEMAVAAAVDPLEFRLRNITNPRMRAVLRRLRASSGWDDLALTGAAWAASSSFGSSARWPWSWPPGRCCARSRWLPTAAWWCTPRSSRDNCRAGSSTRSRPCCGPRSPSGTARRSRPASPTTAGRAVRTCRRSRWCYCPRPRTRPGSVSWSTPPRPRRS